MGTKRTAWALAIGVVLAAPGCGSAALPSAATSASSPAGVRPPVVSQPGPHYPVGVRMLSLVRVGPGPASRGGRRSDPDGPDRDRPLPTLIFYPAAEQGLTASAQLHTSVRNGRGGAAAATGRFPLILFSHGLRGTPELYADALAGWASAGFVIAAPCYPFTNVDATHFDRGDIVNQPADAAYVIKKVRRLDRTAGDPLAGHIDVDQVAAVGHSAGGYTTSGLFAARHPTWLRAGIVIAGWLAPGAFQGPPAPILFVQGARDTVVPLAEGKAAYDAVGWWKSYVLLPDSWHADYMVPNGRQFPLINRTVTDFLRWTLTGDEAARHRLPASSYPAGHAE